MPMHMHPHLLAVAMSPSPIATLLRVLFQATRSSAATTLAHTPDNSSGTSTRPTLLDKYMANQSSYSIKIAES